MLLSQTRLVLSSQKPACALGTFPSVSVLPPKQLLNRPPASILGLLLWEGHHELWPGHCLFTSPPSHPQWDSAHLTGCKKPCLLIPLTGGLIEITNLTMSISSLRTFLAPPALRIMSQFPHTDPGPPFHPVTSFPATICSRYTWPLASHIQAPVPLSSLPNAFSSAQHTRTHV